MEFKEFGRNFIRMVYECGDDNPFIEAADSKYPEDWLMWAMNNLMEAEDFVAAWTKEHPAPIYPTFGEYLRDMANHSNEMAKIPIGELLDTPIPESIAEKYKVAPLNLCEIKKYASDWL